MKISVGTKRMLYELEFFGKYNILCGDSGNGKTTLHQLLTQRLVSSKGIKFKADVEIYPVQKLDSVEILGKYKNALLVIDENAVMLNRPDFSKAVKESENYFLIISRRNFDFLPISVDNYYKLVMENSVTHNVPIFPRFKVNKFTGIDKIVTEDSVSGKKFFEEYFPDFEVDSAHSKSELAYYINNKYSGDERLLVVYDAAAFAYSANAFFEAIKGKSIQILDWESFENFILRQKVFNVVLEQKDCTCVWESLEEYSTKKLSELVEGYSKSSLPRCIKNKSVCSSCSKVNNCHYKHSEFEVDFTITHDTSISIKKLNAF